MAFAEPSPSDQHFLLLSLGNFRALVASCSVGKDTNRLPMPRLLPWQLMIHWLQPQATARHSFAQPLSVGRSMCYRADALADRWGKSLPGCIGHSSVWLPFAHELLRCGDLRWSHLFGCRILQSFYYVP